MTYQAMMKTPLMLAALISPAIAFAEPPSVAVDVAPLHSLVAQVMKTVSVPELVISPGSSPHEYSLRPSEAQSLQDADIVFWVSHRLTPWLDSAIDTLAGNALQVELLDSTGTTKLMQRENALFEAHEHGDEGEDDEHHDAQSAESGEHQDDEHDDDHGVDPHAWLDPSNAAIWLDTIADALSNADPEHAEIYRANAASGKATMEQLKSEVSETLDPVRNKNFIVFHDAYQYFESAFDFPASGAISISDATTPGLARIQQIHDRVKDADVSCVLAEPQFNPSLVETVLDETDARSSVIDPLGFKLELGPELYPELLLELAQTLADCLEEPES